MAEVGPRFRNRYGDSRVSPFGTREFRRDGVLQVDRPLADPIPILTTFRS